MGFEGFHYPLLMRFGATALLSLLPLITVAQADEVADFRPAWIDSYQVWSGRADLNRPNDSYLQNRQVGLVANPLADQIGSLMEHRRVLEWRQQYDDMNRGYDQKQRAGTANQTDEWVHVGAVSGFSNGVMDEIEKRKLQETGDRTAHMVEKDEIASAVIAPGAVVAGFWIGRAVNLRMADDTHFSFRTSIRDRLGQIELHSPILYGSFEFHPQAAENYALIAPTNVDFGRSMDFNHIVDFGAEKYQLRVARSVPFVEVSGSVLYASSSNVVASSLSKQLTPHLAAVVDSIYYLTPYDPVHTIEERVRLRYDLHF